MPDRDKEGAAALSRKAVQWGWKTALGSSSNREVKKECVSCTCKEAGELVQTAATQHGMQDQHAEPFSVHGLVSIFARLECKFSHVCEFFCKGCSAC